MRDSSLCHPSLLSKGRGLSLLNFKAHNSFAKCKGDGMLPCGHILEAEKRIWLVASHLIFQLPPYSPGPCTWTTGNVIGFRGQGGRGDKLEENSHTKAPGPFAFSLVSQEENSEARRVVLIFATLGKKNYHLLKKAAVSWSQHVVCSLQGSLWHPKINSREDNSALILFLSRL